MKKKALLSVVAGAALLMANPMAQEADAASNTQTKVYTYKSTNLSSEQLNALLAKYFPTIKLQKQSEATTTNTDTQTETAQKADQVKEPDPTQSNTQTTTQQPITESKESSSNQAISQLNQFEQQVVELTNEERAKQGIAKLEIDTELSKVAREKSLDMQKNNYFSHTSPTYGSPFDMMKQFGITYRAAGENIAKGQRTPEEVVNAWMNSEGHRKNILSSNFTHIGVGYVENGNYWTQQFIGK
ncbi:CAP domain-containing protein [Bacillus weihaiensis]|uniref:Sporulation protein n=1 Tax=Bacillus weihaiensis TaxID=1547283 RepID=A0A1L3MLV7_9BACI|nr:CAP domain-containing protein [Bacillus weihaiensis]APH03338.1 sporulation protein [Bacillus weihaiensis]